MKTLNEKEKYFLRQLLCSELQKYRDRQDHSTSHGSEFWSEGGEALQGVLNKMDAEE